MVMVYSCFREFIVRSRITTMPPPSTVSMVLASRLGVTASKSYVQQKSLASSVFHLDQQRNLASTRLTCKTHMPNVFPRILWVSL